MPRQGRAAKQTNPPGFRRPPRKRTKATLPAQDQPVVSEMPQRKAVTQVARLQRSVGNQSLGQWVQPAGASQPKQAKPKSKLEKWTQFQFQWGSFRQEIKLPASLASTLPVALRGVGRIEFKLAVDGAKVTFTATLDDKLNLRVAVYSSFDTLSGQASAGLRFGTKPTVRRTLDPLTAQKRVEDAGKRLTYALNNYKKATGAQEEVLTLVPLPADAMQGPRPQSPMALLNDVGVAIYDLYTTVQEVQGQGKEVSPLEFDVGARWSTGVGLNPPEERKRPADFFGVTMTWRF